MKKLGLFILSIIIISCTSENDTQNQDLKNITLKSIETPYNFNNPYDSVGIKHNIVLGEVVKNRENLNKNFDNFVNYSNSIYNKKYGHSKYSLPSSAEISTILSDSTSNYSNVMNSSHFSTNVKQKFSTLVNIMLNSANDDSTTYSTYKKKIVDFENVIMNSNMPQDDIAIILCFTSVARHSGYFWNNQLEHENNYKAMGFFGKRPLWKWIVVGICDTAGGISGGIAGSPTVLGIAGGAVAGFVGASAGAIAVVDWVSPDAPTTPL